MSQLKDQSVKLLQKTEVESESEYVPSAYGYDTGNESDASKKSNSSGYSKIRKSFKPSTKKKIQLTF